MTSKRGSCVFASDFVTPSLRPFVTRTMRECTLIKSIRYAVVAALCLAPAVDAADLNPEQEAALQEVLKSIDPSMREMVRSQLEMTVSMMNSEQLKLFVAGAAKGAAEPEPVQEEPERQATPEDLAYNRKQYEPVMRKHWAAKKEFDQFVDAELRAKCPNPDKYAVFREVERYEMMPLDPKWHRAGMSAEAEIQVLGEVYTPKDGRYDFDFSKVRMTFDKQAVSSAITKACADWSAEAAAFQKKARELMNSGQSDAALRFERASWSKVNPITEALESVLHAQGPAGSANAEMMTALQNPKRVK